MKKFVVAVFDAAVQAYAQPVYVASVGQAVRSFGDEARRKDENNMLSRHPEDYELRLLAVFDEETGVFESQQITCIARGKDYLA